MALEPITRQEQIIAGKDLEPITRMEKFLKQYGGGNGSGDGGSFVLRPTAEEVVNEGGDITCTANYDELAKALEDGRQVEIVFPVGSVGEVPFAIRSTVIGWSYIAGRIGCFIVLFGEPSTVILTNGTYVPNL